MLFRSQTLFALLIISLIFHVIFLAATKRANTQPGVVGSDLTMRGNIGNLRHKTLARPSIGAQHLERRQVAAAKAHQPAKIWHRRPPTHCEIPAPAAIGGGQRCHVLVAAIGLTPPIIHACVA